MYRNSMNAGRGRAHSNYQETGPLMTDHLKVRNLDRELDLLRRKREVVQREQQLLSMQCDLDRKRQYDQTNYNISNVWQQPPPKRANIPQQAKPWMGAAQDNFGPNMSKPMPTNYIPSLLSKKFNPPLIPVAMKPIVHPMLKNTVNQRSFKPINARKDFRPTQVTKNKPQGPPNKLNTYPVKERKNLVLKAISSHNKGNKLHGDPESMILREDQIPNKQVTGRLELALGTIVKEIKNSASQDSVFKTLISSTASQRVMKQAIRERIRSVMLNKTVGPVSDIVKIYREKFLVHSDQDIIDLVVNTSKTVTLVETENPEEFFKKNISSILDKKIREMSSNLLKMYTNNRLKTKSHSTTANDVNKKLDESIDKESTSDNELAMKVLRTLTGKYVTSEETNTLAMYYTKLIEDIIEKKLPEYLPKHKETFLKIFDLDHQFKTVKSMATKLVAKQAEITDAEVSEQQTDANTELNVNEKLDKQIVDNNESKDAVVVKNNEMDEDAGMENNETDEEVVAKNNKIQEQAVIENNDTEKEAVTENRDTQNETLAELIPDTKMISKDKCEESIEMLASTPAEESSSTLKPTTPMLNKIPESSINNEPGTLIPKKTDSPKNTVIMSTPLTKELPYYVKLIGRPQLPNRAAICDFLNSYRPNSIKKHKSINNLLVVGFNNQEDYEKILTATETVIDDITIIIKTNEKVNPLKENLSAKEANDVNKESQNTNNDSNHVQKEEEGRDSAKNNENGICKQLPDSNNAENEDEVIKIIEKEADNQIEINNLSNESDTTVKNLEPIKEEDDIVNQETHESDKASKSSKGTVKESGRATPVRSSSRLSNVTPSTIRTRRSSRLLQE